MLFYYYCYHWWWVGGAPPQAKNLVNCRNHLEPVAHTVKITDFEDNPVWHVNEFTPHDARRWKTTFFFLILILKLNSDKANKVLLVGASWKTLHLRYGKKCLVLTLYALAEHWNILKLSIHYCMYNLPICSHWFNGWSAIVFPRHYSLS